MELEFDALSMKELRDLKARVEKAITTFEDRRKKAAFAELEELARKHGYSLTEFADESGKKKRTVTVAKYANPANPSDTWTGRGRKPRWLIEALDGGKSLEDLAI